MDLDHENHDEEIDQRADKAYAKQGLEKLFGEASDSDFDDNKRSFSTAKKTL